MTVSVKLFAGAREAAGVGELLVECDEPATVAQLREVLRSAAPEIAPLLDHALFAVDESYATDDTPILANAQIALIPPVSGG